MEYSGTLFVNTHSDDDIIGIVFGYQSPRKFFVASWKKRRQVYWDTRPFRATAESAFNIKVKLPLGVKIKEVRIFLLGHYLFRDGNSFARVKGLEGSL